MNKKVMAICFSFLFFNLAFAQKIVLAPIVVYDFKGYKIEEKNESHEKIYENLSSFWTNGLLYFETINKNEYEEVLTVLDAEKVCNVKKEEYLLYGYIQKSEISWHGNIKLYSTSHKKIIKEFFASDELSKYERFIDVFSNNIFFGLKEILGIEQGRKISGDTILFQMNLAVSGFYWTPIDLHWSSVYNGIAGGAIGLEVFPYQRKTKTNSFRFELSTKVNFEYAYAEGKANSYPLVLHTMKIIPTLVMRFNLNKINAFYIGVGAFYEEEFLSVLEKYEEESSYWQKLFGLHISSGYEISINNVISLGTGVGFDFHLSENSYIAIKPQISIITKMLWRK